jgi:Phytanoyl-CoA dioxygenase (PhyH)
MAAVTNPIRLDISELKETIYRDGIVGIPKLLPTERADQLDEDLKTEVMAALSHEGGMAPRGWNRFYFEPYPEPVRRFLDLITHPVITALSVELFGEDYRVVELGSDIPFPGAVNQPWHRDFPMPDETREGRLSSICLNVSSVDVTPDMGPFQIAPGTQFELGDEFDGGMFPDESRQSEYDRRMESKFGMRGSVSVRSGLTLHRGSKSSSRSRLRPVAIVGIVSSECGAVTNRVTNPDDPHVPRLRVSQRYIDDPPGDVVQHLSYEVVADTERNLPPHFTHHTFEGLKMAEMA